MKFLSLANRSLRLSHEAFLNCFLSGLNPDIRQDVVAMCPPTLFCAVALAKLFEEKYNLFLNHLETHIPKYSKNFTYSSSYGYST